MNGPDLRAFLTPKHFRSSVEIAGNRWEITLETPDLSDAPRSVWGDWGPMAEIPLDTPSGVRLRHRCAALSVAGEGEIDTPTIRLSSPMQWSQRQRTPFVLELADEARGLRFAGSLDRRGKPVALAVKTLRPESEIARLLSDDLALRDAWSPRRAHLRVA